MRKNESEVVLPGTGKQIGHGFRQEVVELVDVNEEVHPLTGMLHLPRHRYLVHLRNYQGAQ